MSPSSPTRRVLFVDDDAQVLSALRNVTRRYRGSWESTFALGGALALEELARAPFDVVVSDMRMPGIDGAALLGIVRDRFPATARIVLSGFADTRVMERAVTVSHQMLGKPFDIASLRDTIERTLRVHELVSDPHLRAVIGRLGALPPAPSLYPRLLRALESDVATSQTIAAVIEADPGVCAQLLRIANSPFYGVRHPVTSVMQAVGLLGREFLKGAVLSAELRMMFDRAGALEAERIDAIQQRSFLVARLMRDAAAPALQEEAWVGGILHDIGSILVAHALPAVFTTILTEQRQTGLPLAAVERAVLGVDHGAVGAYLLRLWGLPPRIVEATALQLEPRLGSDGPLDLLVLLHAASSVVGPPGTRPPDPAFLAAADGAALLDKFRVAKTALQHGGSHD